MPQYVVFKYNIVSGVIIIVIFTALYMK